MASSAKKFVSVPEQHGAAPDAAPRSSVGPDLVPKLVSAVGGKPKPTPKMLYLQNELIKIGVDEAAGGGIAFFSNAKADKNVLNSFDLGRYIQQSYYGREDNSNWNGNPWKWNPVQCGSWQNQPANVIKCCQEGGAICTCVNPRNWAGQQLCGDVLMSSKVALEGDKAHITFSLKYTGSEENPVRIQELPAVFFNRNLSELWFYSGAEPWKGGKLDCKTPGGRNENFKITENWAAYIDPTTKQGVGVYTPMAGTMTAYRVGKDGSTASSDCSYFAPTMRFAINPGMEFSYHAFITLGTVEQIRKVFSGTREWALKNNPKLLENPVPKATLAI